MQKRAVEDFIRQRGGALRAEFVEVQSGKNDDRLRPEALKLCQLNWSTPLIAKLDQLSRYVAFLPSLQQFGVRFVACDLSQPMNAYSTPS